VALWLVPVGGSSCKRRGDTDGAAVVGTSSLRQRLRSYRSLLREAGRAELSIGGLLIDLGSADAHKYTRGGWRTGWSANQRDGKTSFAAASAATAVLDLLWPAGEVTEIVTRLRSDAVGQSLAVFVDGTPLGEASVPSRWQPVRIPLRRAIGPGHHRVELRFARAAPGGAPRAAIDWLWLANQRGAAPPEPGGRVQSLQLGGQPRRALVAPGPRTYGFYLVVPDRATLVFDHGSAGATRFAVRARDEAGKLHELWSQTGPQNGWREVAVKLDRLQGQVIRLEFTTEGEGSAGWGEPEIMVEPGSRSLTRVARSGVMPRNLMIILMDTARADAYRPFGGRRVKTPAFNALAGKSVTFTAAYNNENWTKPSVATLLSGLYPASHDTKNDQAMLPPEVEILPEILTRHGFQTAGFVANGYISEKFGFQQGWGSFRNYIRENRPSEAEHVYPDALQWLRQARRSGDPYFLYIQTIDPHVVYRADRRYTRLYFPGEYTGPIGPSLDGHVQEQISLGRLAVSDTDLDWIRALYHGEVTYHDEHMGVFLDQLEAMGVFQDTLLVVTNDHGEELFEHQRLGHGHSLHEELLRAPTLLHYPPMLARGTTVKEVVEQVDMLPTMLDLLGLPPADGIDGRSLVPLLKGEHVSRPHVAISEFLDEQRAVRVGDWKLIATAAGVPRLFRVTADPTEQRDLVARRPLARRLCEVHLGEGLATPAKGQRLEDFTTRAQFKAGAAELDPQLRKQLEALGYLGD
jgi:arylsulfatase A-like enzyme